MATDIMAEIKAARKSLRTIVKRVVETEDREGMQKVLEEEEWETKRTAAIELFYKEPCRSFCVAALWTAGKSKQEKFQKTYDALLNQDSLDWGCMSLALRAAYGPSPVIHVRIVQKLGWLAQLLEMSDSMEKLEEAKKKHTERARLRTEVIAHLHPIVIALLTTQR